jgi:hypothetical protein
MLGQGPGGSTCESSRRQETLVASDHRAPRPMIFHCHGRSLGSRIVTPVRSHGCFCAPMPHNNGCRPLTVSETAPGFACSASRIPSLPPYHKMWLETVAALYIGVTVTDSSREVSHKNYICRRKLVGHGTCCGDRGDLRLFPCGGQFAAIRASITKPSRLEGERAQMDRNFGFMSRR